jgi:hypothetical protein
MLGGSLSDHRGSGGSTQDYFEPVVSGGGGVEGYVQLDGSGYAGDIAL